MQGHQLHRPLRRLEGPGDLLVRWHAAAQTRAFLVRETASRRSVRQARLHGRDGNDEGFVSVESIGWIGIAVVVVAVVGLIVRTKLAAMANSLPDTLGW